MATAVKPQGVNREVKLKEADSKIPVLGARTGREVKCGRRVGSWAYYPGRKSRARLESKQPLIGDTLVACCVIQPLEAPEVSPEPDSDYPPAPCN